MSRYLYRHYEGFIEKVDEIFSRLEELPETAPEGYYVKVQKYTVYKWYVKEDGFWKATDRNEFKKYVYFEKYIGYDRSVLKNAPEGSWLISVYSPEVKQKHNDEWYSVQNKEVAETIINLATNKIDELDFPKDILDGVYAETADVFEEAYYLFKNGEWHRVDRRPNQWSPLKVYIPQNTKPKPSSYYDIEGNLVKEAETTEQYFRRHSLKVFKNSENKEIVMRMIDGISTGCGSFCDNYVTGNWKDSAIESRGIPVDVSPETKEELKNKYEDDGRYYGYNHTYATCSELEQLYSSELKEAMNKIFDKINKDNVKNYNRKLDFIINNLHKVEKHYLEALGEFNKKKSEYEYQDEDSEEYYDEDEYEYTLQELMKEELADVREIEDEIEYMRVFKDFYDIYNNDNIRVIYCIA